MTPTTRSNWRHWTPAIVAAGVIGAGALVLPLTANAAVDLPDKTPAEVLELVRNTSVDTFSGTVKQTSNLGLPDLAGLAPTDKANDDGEPSPASAAVELLTGSYTANIFVSGPDQARVQILDQLDERNIIRNGSELWYYNSDENEAFHATVAEHSVEKPGSPDDVAEMFLDRIDPTTEVTVGTDRMIAGREVYDLTLTPRTDETLVGSVNIAVDGETGLPLEVTVTSAATNEPAFSTAYTDVNYDAPDPELFVFMPPEGATVTEVGGGDKARPHAADQKPGIEPTVVGEGWDAVAVVPPGGQELPEMLTQLSTPVEGGRLLETTLVNVLITDDGRTLVGPVTTERLQAVASNQ